MNVFTFTGRLGNDAERRYTPSGSAVCNFSVAVDSGYGDQKKTTWIRCALWGKRAEGGVVDYLTKGALVGVSGELSAREYESNSQTKTSIEVSVREITLLGSKSESDARSSHNGGGQTAMGQANYQASQNVAARAEAMPDGGFPAFEDDSIPF